MTALTKEQKLKRIREVCREHNVTAYEIYKNVPLTEAGALRILDGTSKNPHNTSLNAILDYLEERILGTAIEGNKVAKEELEVYRTNKDELLTAFENFQKIIEERDEAISTTLQLTIINTEETKIMANISAKKLENIDESLRRLENTIASLAKNRSS